AIVRARGFPMVVEDSSPDHRAPAPPEWEGLVVIGGGGLLVIVACVVGYFLWPSRPAPRFTVLEPRAATVIDRGPYIGSRACRSCHPGEYAAHTWSGHARTLRRAADIPLAGRLDGLALADPELSGITWAYTRQDGKLQVNRKGRGTSERLVLEFAF